MEVKGIRNLRCFTRSDVYRQRGTSLHRLFAHARHHDHWELPRDMMNNRPDWDRLKMDWQNYYVCRTHGRPCLWQYDRNSCWLALAIRRGWRTYTVAITFLFISPSWKFLTDLSFRLKVYKEVRFLLLSPLLFIYFFKHLSLRWSQEQSFSSCFLVCGIMVFLYSQYFHFMYFYFIFCLLIFLNFTVKSILYDESLCFKYCHLRKKKQKTINIKISICCDFKRLIISYFKSKKILRYVVNTNFENKF